jgi:hypothetical protein
VIPRGGAASWEIALPPNRDASIEVRKWPEPRSRAWPFLTARIGPVIRQEMNPAMLTDYVYRGHRRPGLAGGCAPGGGGGGGEGLGLENKARQWTWPGYWRAGVTKTGVLGVQREKAVRIGRIECIIHSWSADRSSTLRWGSIF